MTEKALLDLYNQRIQELRSDIPRQQRLDHPDATALKKSRLCGSQIEVDIMLDGDGVVTDYGQTVKACILGQTSASVMGHQIVGRPADEVIEAGRKLKAMLKDDGPAPEGVWKDLEVLKPAAAYPARHASILLAFDAVEDAVSQIRAKQAS